MPNPKNVHVVPHGKDWAVKREGGERASSVHSSQAEAWNKARDSARNDKGEAFLHNRTGQIRERETYGHDPNPPKDKD